MATDPPQQPPPGRPPQATTPRGAAADVRPSPKIPQPSSVSSGTAPPPPAASDEARPRDARRASLPATTAVSNGLPCLPQTPKPPVAVAAAPNPRRSPPRTLSPSKAPASAPPPNGGGGGGGGGASTVPPSPRTDGASAVAAGAPSPRQSGARHVRPSGGGAGTPASIPSVPSLDAADDGPRRQPPLSGRHPNRDRVLSGDSASSSLGASDRASDAPAKLTALVWKRRGGFGKRLKAGMDKKKRSRRAWERRRIELRGSRLVYYKELRPHNGGAATGDSDSSDDEAEDYRPSPPHHLQQQQQKGGDPDGKAGRAAPQAGGGGKSKWALLPPTTLYQTAKDGLISAKDYAKGYVYPGESSSAVVPRGELDMIKERAAAAASTAPPCAPTPYAITIKVKGETKWQLCFDSQAQQMEWLAALTDVVVARSVEEHNRGSSGHGRPRAASAGGAEDFNASTSEDISPINATLSQDESLDDSYDGTPAAPTLPPLQDGRPDSHPPAGTPRAETPRADTPRDGDGARPEETLRLTAMVWKRRSGFSGKLGSKSAWERRRLTLRGSRLMYFKSSSEARGGRTEEEDEDDDSSEDEDGTAAAAAAHGHSHGPGEYHGVAAGMKVPKKTFYQTAKDNIKTATENIKSAARTVPVPSSLSSSDYSSPRGILDIVKENATVAASNAHSGAPTPYAISVKVRNETRWKVCFDTQAQQAEWLAALTDVVVNRSVADYNAAELTEFRRCESFHQTTWEEYVAAGEGTPDRVPSSGGESGAGGLIQDQRARNPPRASTALGALRAASNGIVLNGGYWLIPRNNFFIMLMFVNGALVYAHSTPMLLHQLVFLMVFVTVGLFLCLMQESDYNSSLGNGTLEELQTSVQTLGPPALPSDPVPSSTALDRSVPKETPEVDSEEEGESVRKPVTADRGLATSPSPSYKPIAGSTAMRLLNPTDPAVNGDDHPLAGWRASPGSSFKVRSHGYLSNKEKVPSPSELYRLVHADVFESERRVPDMARRVRLPPVEFDDAGERTWKSPDVFVVSFALPTEAPRITKSTADGLGYMITMYFAMKEETREVLRRVTAPDYDPSNEAACAGADAQRGIVNGVRLFEKWCRMAPEDPKWQARFKVIIDAHNLSEIGVPSWIAKHNGKPFLIKRSGVTGFLYDHSAELSCMEFDVSFHSFPYLFKQATAYLKDHYFKKVLVSFAFCIEGRNDDELPEMVIGEGMQLCYPDPAIAITAEDLFSGKSPSSFDPGE